MSGQGGGQRSLSSLFGGVAGGWVPAPRGSRALPGGRNTACLFLAATTRRGSPGCGEVDSSFTALSLLRTCSPNPPTLCRCIHHGDVQFSMVIISPLNWGASWTFIGGVQSFSVPQFASLSQDKFRCPYLPVRTEPCPPHPRAGALTTTRESGCAWRQRPGEAAAAEEVMGVGLDLGAAGGAGGACRGNLPREEAARGWPCSSHGERLRGRQPGLRRWGHKAPSGAGWRP